VRYCTVENKLYYVTITFQTGYKVTIDNVESYEVAPKAGIKLKETKHTEQHLTLAKPELISCVTHRLVDSPDYIKERAAKLKEEKLAKEAAKPVKKVRARKKRTLPVVKKEKVDE